MRIKTKKNLNVCVRLCDGVQLHRKAVRRMRRALEERRANNSWFVCGRNQPNHQHTMQTAQWADNPQQQQQLRLKSENNPWHNNLTNKNQVSPSVCALWVLRLVRLWLTGHCEVSVGVGSRWNDCLSVWPCYQLAIMSSPLWNNQLWKWLTSSLAAALWRGLVMSCAETAAF